MGTRSAMKEARLHAFPFWQLTGCAKPWRNRSVSNIISRRGHVSKRHVVPEPSVQTVTECGDCVFADERRVAPTTTHHRHLVLVWHVRFGNSGCCTERTFQWAVSVCGLRPLGRGRFSPFSGESLRFGEAELRLHSWHGIWNCQEIIRQRTQRKGYERLRMLTVEGWSRRTYILI